MVTRRDASLSAYRVAPGSIVLMDLYQTRPWIQTVMTCRTEEQASLETTKCVIERPTLVSAKCAEEILAGRNQNMGER